MLNFITLKQKERDENRKLFGSLPPISSEEHKKLLEETGIDIDGTWMYKQLILKFSVVTGHFVGSVVPYASKWRWLCTWVSKFGWMHHCLSQLWLGGSQSRVSPPSHAAQVYVRHSLKITIVTLWTNYLFFATWIFTSSVCSRGNVSIMSVCLLVCLCVFLGMCVCLSVCSGYNFWMSWHRNFIFGVVLHLDHI